MMMECKRMKKCPFMGERELWSHAPRLTPSDGDHPINKKNYECALATRARKQSKQICQDGQSLGALEHFTEKRSAA